MQNVVLNAFKKSKSLIADSICSAVKKKSKWKKNLQTFFGPSIGNWFGTVWSKLHLINMNLVNSFLSYQAI